MKQYFKSSLTLRLFMKIIKLKPKYTGMKENFLYIGHQRFKQNNINTDLKRAARIASTFTEEIPIIKQKFLSADYAPRFINTAIRQFNKKCNGNTQDDYIILPDFFDIPKPLVLAEIMYCPRNETLSKRFINKCHELTNNSYEVRIKWIAKKGKHPSKLKIWNPHLACVIYERGYVFVNKYTSARRGLT